MADKNYQATSHKIKVLWDWVASLASAIIDLTNLLNETILNLNKLWDYVRSLHPLKITNELDSQKCFLLSEVANPYKTYYLISPGQWQVVAHFDLKVTNLGPVATNDDLYIYFNGVYTRLCGILAVGESAFYPNIASVNGTVLSDNLIGEGIFVTVWVDPMNVISNTSIESRKQQIVTLSLFFL